ncbi:MAG: hypothetical protein V3U29_10155, partial [Phycisphaeraceae bacterium]
HPQGVNENQGAESTLCWLLALLALYDHNLETRPAAGPQPEQAAAPKVKAPPPKPAIKRAKPPGKDRPAPTAAELEARP